jgi:hypothetical protein
MLARRASSDTHHIRVLDVTQTPADQANPGTTVLKGADPARVGRWLAERLGQPAWRDCSITGIGHGRSNLTFRVTSSAGAGSDSEPVDAHGDYRIDNLMYDRDDPGRVRAVLDWEMPTLGDPLADLGLLMVYWNGADDPPVWRRAQLLPSPSQAPGFPSRRQLAEPVGRQVLRERLA